MMDTEKKNIVWIVEDDDMFRTSLETLVHVESSMQLGISTNSVERVLNIRDEDRLPEIFLLDVGLPGMSGLEAIAHFKKRWPEVCIIMLTIFEDDERIFEAIKSGADGYLLKRTPGEEIIKGVKDVLNGGSAISPAIAKKVLRMLASAPPKSKSPLTSREQDILELLVEGLSLPVISDKLGISRNTSVTHIKNIYKKLQVHSRGEVVAKAIQDRLV